MPPSPALRCSPGRELRADRHKRGRSFESGMLVSEKDEDLALFNEMQTKEQDNFLLQSSDDFEDTFSTKLRYFSDFKLGISIPVRGESSELLNVDGEKNDYDWLLTPPDTPLFRSLEDEAPSVNLAHRGRPRSQPISISRSSTMEKSQRSSRGSQSPHRLSPSPRSGTNTLQSRGRPSSAPHSSPPASLRHATPSRRPSPPPGKPSTPVPRSFSPAPRRVSTGSSGIVTSSGVRGSSPAKASRGNSASPKIQAWQSSIPGFSTDAPPNLRTSLADRPATYVRGSSPASRNSRGSSPASGNGRDSSVKSVRQSMSPTASRSVGSSHSQDRDRDRFSSHSKGSVVSSGDDDVDSLQSIPVGSSDRSTSRRVGVAPNNRSLAFSKKPGKTISPSSAPKRSFDYALRQMDHRKGPQNMFRPLLSSVPSTTFYVGKASSARNSSVTTSSNASSDLGTSVAPDMEGSDPNHNDMANGCKKAQYTDVQDEVFVFDKVEAVNEDRGHKIHDESLNIQDVDFVGGPTIEPDHGKSEEFSHHDKAMPASMASESLHFNNDSPEVDNVEDTLLCSKCGCRYSPSDSVERDVKLCAVCSRKNDLSTVTTPVTMIRVGENSQVLSNKALEEYTLSDNLVPLMVQESKLSKVPNIAEPGASQLEENVKHGQAFSGEQCEGDLQDNYLARSLVEEGDERLVNQQEFEQPTVSYSLPSSGIEGQQLQHFNDYPSSKVDVSEGAGISVLLLKRSSSSKGPVVQGRTFTASMVPYDDPSYARDNTNSMRSSFGHGSASASSSVDFSSARQTESRVQRQSSGKKSDMENYMLTKHHRTGSSFSGISNHACQSSALSTSTHEDDFEASLGNLGKYIEKTPLASQEQVISSENTEIDDTRGTLLIEDIECSESCRREDVSTSELPSHTITLHLEDSSEPSFPNENCEDFLNNARSISDVGASATPESSFIEEHTMLNTSMDGVDVTQVLTDNFLDTISEIEIENGHQCSNGSETVVSSKSALDDIQEPSVPHSDKESTVSVPEPNASNAAHCILEESTVMVEGHRGSVAKSLTLDEATDTILFCSSIVHNLAYQAASIALEKEKVVSLEGSRPTVTLLGKQSPDRREPLRGRIVGKRGSKSQKARQRRVETETKPSPCRDTENDENKDESLPRMVGVHNKGESMKPPKLESKCNCRIM